MPFPGHSNPPSATKAILHAGLIQSVIFEAEHGYGRADAGVFRGPLETSRPYWRRELFYATGGLALLAAKTDLTGVPQVRLDASSGSDRPEVLNQTPGYGLTIRNEKPGRKTGFF